MKLENIGFYTLCDERARNTSPTSPMWRCELVLTDRCNFKCPYCRGLAQPYKGDMVLSDALGVLHLWAKDGLKHVRFSGGEPTLYAGLPDAVRYARALNVRRVAVSTNGSAKQDTYNELLRAGVDDFSVSLDACCSSFANRMAGVSCGFDRLCDNIRFLAKRAYTTVGVVLNEENVGEFKRIVEFADGLGVADIRVIPAAQFGKALSQVALDSTLLDRHPILRYRVENARNGRGVRGLLETDPRRCYLVQDDSAVAGGFHFPCIIYTREQGKPIGVVGPNMRTERIEWARTHDVHEDPICKENCLDVCVDYLRKCEENNP